MSFLVGEALRIVGIWIANVLVLGLADWAARKAELGTEASRKTVHMAGGLVAAPLPWILRSDLSMAVLAGGAVLGLASARRLGLLSSVHGVRRTSVGDVAFPLGVALLFFVGRREPVLYLVGLSYLVLADAVAALIGRRYGRATYEVERQRRSVEGSVTFFAVSFVTAHLLLLLGTEIPRLSSVLVAAQLALLVTCFEAISLGGYDNLFVAAVTCLLAMRLTDLPPEVLARDLAVQVTIGALVAYVVWRTSFAGVTGAITLGLYLYGAYALGGALWLITPMVVVTAYLILRSLYWQGEPIEDRQFQVSAVFYVVISGAALYLLASTLDQLGVGWRGEPAVRALLPAYLGVAAGQFSILIYALWRPWDDTGETLDPGPVPSVLGLVVVAPLAFAVEQGPRAPLTWIVTTAFLALWLYRRGRASARWPRRVPWHSRLQAVAVLASVVLLAPLLFGLLGP